MVLSGNLIRRRGTFLGTTNKGNPFKYPMPDGTFKDRTTEIVVDTTNWALMD